MNTTRKISYSLGKVERFRLENGLTVLIREDHTAPIVSTMIWYRVGSRHEKEGISGISHFLEHMLFKGSNHYGKGEIDLITARQGGSNNAFTSNDYTAYYFNFASDRWWSALEIEADRMRNSRFDPQEFELERQVIVEELKMDLDTPWGALRQEVETHSFKVHPYRLSVIGRYEDLQSITREQLIDYYNRYYVPNNAVLVLAGDLDLREALDRVHGLFDPILPGEVPLHAGVAEPRRTEQVRLELDRPARVPRMLLAFPAPSVHQKEHYALHVLDQVLSQGKLSRLHRRLVEEERLASWVSTEFVETLDPYLLFVRVQPQEFVDLAQVEAAIFEEMNRLCNAKISEAELQRAKNQCLTQFFNSFETTLDQVMQLGLMETLDEFEYWYSYPKQIQHLDSEDIRQVAQRCLTPEQATVGILPNARTRTDAN